MRHPKGAFDLEGLPGQAVKKLRQAFWLYSRDGGDPDLAELLVRPSDLFPLHQGT